MKNLIVGGYAWLAFTILAANGILDFLCVVTDLPLSKYVCIYIDVCMVVPVYKCALECVVSFS